MTPLPISVAVSGNQANGGPPSFAGAYGSPPAGVTVSTSGLSCSQVSPSTAITGNLASGSYTLVPASCAGAVLGGPNGDNYVPSYTSAANDFTVTGGPVTPHAAASRAHPRLLAGRLRRRHLHLRVRAVLRVDRRHQVAATGRRHQPHREQGRVLAGGVGRRRLRLRQRRLLRVDPRGRAGPGRLGLPHSLNAPIVGMVPSSDGGGTSWWRRTAGSSPSVTPGSKARAPEWAVVRVQRSRSSGRSGNGYWLVTQTGSVYAFGDAPSTAHPGTRAPRSRPPSAPPTAAATGSSWRTGPCTPTGTLGRGGPAGAVGGFNPASAIFSDADGGGYWVASAAGCGVPLRRRAERRLHGGEPPQRLHHRGDRLLTVG